MLAMRIVGLFVYLMRGRSQARPRAFSRRVVPLLTGTLLGAVAGLLVGLAAWIRAEQGS